MPISVDQCVEFLQNIGRATTSPRLRGALQSWTDRAKQSLGELMRREVSPDGTSYAPLSPITVERKGHNQILFETGELRESVEGSGSGHIETVSETGVRLGTSHEKQGSPVAMKLHYGDGNIPARPFVGVTEEMVDDATESVADEAMRQIAGF